MQWSELQKLLDEIAKGQSAHLLECGRAFVPTLTPEDLLQPNDYPELEDNPLFRYEEGVMAGILTVQMAFQRHLKENVE